MYLAADDVQANTYTSSQNSHRQERSNFIWVFFVVILCTYLIHLFHHFAVDDRTKLFPVLRLLPPGA